MTTPEFKTGDLVRVTKQSDIHFWEPGRVGYIRSFAHTSTTYGPLWMLQAAAGSRGYQTIPASDLELVRSTPKPSPLAMQVLSHLSRLGSITAMDAMRAMGLSSGSLTRRLTELREAGHNITHETKVDPITRRRYGVWTFHKPNQEKAANVTQASTQEPSAAHV